MEERQEKAEAPKMISIWIFVSAVLAVYGLIVLAMGIYYESAPEAQSGQLATLNPSLWWGGIMLAAAGILYLLDRRAS